MDQMLTYCAQMSDDSAEACMDYDVSQSGNVQQYYSNYECGAGSLNDAERERERERDLLKQCENYRAQIKRQEEEINSYRQHIEVIEEEYSKLSSNLSAAEKNIRQNEKQLFTYQETIGSLKNELDSFYNIESSLHESESTPSDLSLSFSNDSNIKLYNGGSSSSKSDPTCTQLSPVDKIQLFDSYKKMCLENVDLKRQNEFLQMEVRRLKKDNEDFQDMLSECKKPHEFVNSTPMKNLNFISYKALNVDINSFSIDEDFDGENALQFLDQHKHKSLHNYSANHRQDLAVLSPISATMSAKAKDVSSIENQEVPSILTKEITQINTNLNYPHKPSRADSINTVPPYDVSSIEDEKFPPLGLPDSSASDKSLKAANKVIQHHPKVAVVSTSAAAPLVESTSTTSPLANKSLSATVQLISPISVEITSSSFSTSSSSLTLPAEETCRSPSFTLLDFSRFLSSFSSSYSFPIGKKLFYFVFLTVIIILTSTNVKAKLQTRLAPFYTIQEIFTDILCQFYLWGLL